jgi:ribosome maturation factor RimP
MSSLTRHAITGKVEEIAERVASSAGLEIVEVEFAGGGRNRLLRIYIDRPAGGGVTLADCELISQQVGTILDIEDVIPGGGYTLEVSSPGVERKLLKPRDYERFTGSKVRLVLRQPLENQRRWEGLLTGFASGVLSLEPQPGRTLQIPLDQVEKANLKYDW